MSQKIDYIKINWRDFGFHYYCPSCEINFYPSNDSEICCPVCGNIEIIKFEDYKHDD